MSTMRPPFTTSMTGPLTTPSDSLIFSIVPQARSYWARFFDRTSRPSLSSFWRTSASIGSPRLTISEGSTSLRMESSRTGITPFGLEADVEEHLVLVDLDDRALDDVAVVELDDGGVDGVLERRAAEVVLDDRTGDVLPVLVEGAHRLGGEQGGALGHGVGVGHGVRKLAFRTGSPGPTEAAAVTAEASWPTFDRYSTSAPPVVGQLGASDRSAVPADGRSGIALASAQEAPQAIDTSRGTASSRRRPAPPR